MNKAPYKATGEQPRRMDLGDLVQTFNDLGAPGLLALDMMQLIERALDEDAPACIVCGNKHHLYVKAEYKLANGRWEPTGHVDNVECTNCDAEMAFLDETFGVSGDEVTVFPELPGSLDLRDMEALERFLSNELADCRYRAQKTALVDLLNPLRASLGLPRYE